MGCLVPNESKRVNADRNKGKENHRSNCDFIYYNNVDIISIIFL